MQKPNLQKFITRRMSPYTSDLFMGVVGDETKIKKYTGLPGAIPHTAFLDGVYYVDADWTKEMTESYFLKEPKVFWDFSKRGYEVGEDLWNFVKTNYKIFETKQDFWTLHEKFEAISAFLQLTHPLSKAIENHVTEILKDKGVVEADLTEALIEVSVPEKLNGPSQEAKELDDIRVKKESNPDFDLAVAIKEHTEKWSYLGYRDCFSNGFDESFFIKRLEEGKKEIKTEKSKFFLTFSDKEQEWIDLMKEFVFFRNYRTEILYGGFFFAEKFWFKLSLANNLGEKDLSYYVTNEIVDLFESGKKLSEDILTERKNKFGVVMDFGKTSIITGDELQNKINEVKPVEDTNSKLKGTVACKGIARGYAKIVMGSANQDKVQSGDILVTSMTTPDLLPCMGRAAAFITDEGGITCHAAIVAREMKKPCIIGTKMATQILKDGDLVEVDANTGVINIIK